MNHQERSQIIDALLDGDISEADFLRIEAELTVDPDARREYYDRVRLTVLLETVAPEHIATSRSTPLLQLQRSHYWRHMLAAGCCAVTFAAFAVWHFTTRETDPRSVSVDPPQHSGVGRSAPTAIEAEASGFGVISGQSNALWLDAVAHSDGALVPGGTMHLASGLVQLELFSGVTVVVEGAAEFAVLSSMEMSVTQGKVRAHVPQAASGFRIHTQDGDVVDLGTEFAIDVSSIHTDVHVLDGDIEWHDAAKGMQRLEKGDGLRSSGDTPPMRLAADAGLFISDAELRDQINQERKRRRDRWMQNSPTRNDDPRLLAWYRIGANDPWSRRLTNQAAGRSTATGEAAIVAASRSADRWGVVDGALDFSPTGSRVRMMIPGEHRCLTLLCWVRINSLDRWYNSLFLTDGHDLHEPHWQIMEDGRLFFSVKKRDTWDKMKGERDKHIFYSPPFWNSSLSGKWLMLATVYDVDAAQVTHYLNGQQLSQEAVPHEYLVESVTIGNASLGNWGMPERSDPHFAVRNLNGTMDEFALFGAALSPEEIAKLYEDGRP